MDWTDLEEAQPRLAARVRERLIDPGVVLVGTVTPSGTARISPVEPFLLDGVLWLSMMLGSRKAADLLRDPRVLVHSIVTSRDGADGEVKVRGRAIAEGRRPVLHRYADAVGEALGWHPVVGAFHLFAVDLHSVSSVSYDARGDQHVAIWPPGREFVRPMVTATEVGDPRPAHDLLR